MDPLRIGVIGCGRISDIYFKTLAKYPQVEVAACASLDLAESQAKAAQRALEAGTGDAQYYTDRLTTGRFYMKRMLPETKLRLARIETGADPVMDLPAEAF